MGPPPPRLFRSYYAVCQLAESSAERHGKDKSFETAKFFADESRSLTVPDHFGKGIRGKIQSPSFRLGHDTSDVQSGTKNPRVLLAEDSESEDTLGREIEQEDAEVDRKNRWYSLFG